MRSFARLRMTTFLFPANPTTPPLTGQPYYDTILIVIRLGTTLIKNPRSIAGIFYIPNQKVIRLHSRLPSPPLLS
ncbi:MAG: hypothetical protein Q7S48_03365, partial [bacterium]|nr:hypothetical protein [bacterium]